MWLTEEKARQANRRRNDLLASLSGKAHRSFLGSKIHTGALSPGCRLCGEGRFSCLFINALCTRNCFYCPQDRSVRTEITPEAEAVFNGPDGYIGYLKAFNVQGIGFSGGESFLALDSLLQYAKRIKKRLGREAYLWVYTNGDLVDKKNVKKLKTAGIDEIRFNIAARDYDLQPVAVARTAMKTVTVEIPCIPEDYEKVKKALPRMQRAGVDYMNIHQLYTTRYNYGNFMKRDYTFLRQSRAPIYESEITALKLLQYATAKKIELPIHYCSSSYKERLQSAGKRTWRATAVKRDFEEVTGAKFIRSLSIQDTPEKIGTIAKKLRAGRRRSRLWTVNDEKTELFVHGSLIRHIPFGDCTLTVRYFDSVLKNTAQQGPGRTYSVDRVPVAQLAISGAYAIRSFHRLFIEHTDERKVLKEFFRTCDLETKKDVRTMKKDAGALFGLKRLEEIEEGFPKLH